MGLDVFTIPTGAAEQYLESNPATDTVVDRTDADPEVSLDAGYDVETSGLSAMWNVTEEFKSAVASIQYDEGLTGDAIRAKLEANGAGDLFPSLSAADLARITAETKIPVAESWADRVGAGTASWDGLLSEAALASFHKDQMALDDRIRGAV